MAKKQTRRSISVSRTTYERLKAFCESNGISMSQFVESRVGDFLEGSDASSTPMAAATTPRPAPRPALLASSRDDLLGRAVPPASPAPVRTVHATSPSAPVASVPAPRPSVAATVPMTSAAARFAVEPPPPIIRPRTEQREAPKPPTQPTADQIFTF